MVLEFNLFDPLVFSLFLDFDPLIENISGQVTLRYGQKAILVFNQI